MGVDYEANFGIGVEVDCLDFSEGDDYECMGEYLDHILSESKYVYASYGEEAYNGEENTYIILINEPFKDGYDITKKVKELENFLKAKDLQFDKIDVVGGLLVW